MDRKVEKFLKDRPAEAYSSGDVARILYQQDVSSLTNFAKSVLVTMAVESSLKQLVTDGSVSVKTVDGTPYYRAIMGRTR